MKYSTLEYDMNRPSIKVINVPLDSDYGVAVKVFKDGQLIETSLSVGGQTPNGTRADWQLFELSSGSEPCKKLIGVNAAEMGSEHYGHTWTEHVENEYDFTEEFNTYFPLSALFSEDTLRLEASKTQLSGWLMGDPNKIEGLYVIQSPGESEETDWILNPAEGKWELTTDESWMVDYIDVKNTDAIQALYLLDARQSAELRVVIETDGIKEGEAVGFKLIVNEEDMSRIETKITE